MANDYEKLKDDPRMNELEVIVRNMAGDNKVIQEAIIRDLAGRLNLWGICWDVYKMTYDRVNRFLKKKINGTGHHKMDDVQKAELSPGIKYAIVVMNNQLRYSWADAGYLQKKKNKGQEGKVH